MKILVVDDERLLVKGIKFNLENDGYTVDSAHDGATALTLFRENRYDLILLDLMLPEVDGLSVCRAIRESSNVPVIMLTAKGDGSDKLIGFEYGADDYVTKPFSPREVLARAQAILRRTRPEKHALQILDIGHLCIDPIRHVASVAGEVLRLTPAEFRILYHLAQKKETVLTRQKIIELSSANGELTEGMERTADAHIKNLRRKLAMASENGLSIETVRGVGYKMVVC